MRTDALKMRPLALAMAMAAATAVTASAQQRELFRWSGRVDQEIQLTMSGNNLTTSNIGPREVGERRARVTSMLPTEGGYVTVQMEDGRGSADVIQQPNAANGFTTIISIKDPQPGAADYRIVGYWQPAAAGEVGPPFGRREREGAYGDRDRDRGRGALVMHWSGDVDDDLNIRVRPGGTDYQIVSGKEPHNVESNFSGMPANGAFLDIRNVQGRGSVSVIQQPTPENGYTAIIRVHDPDRGRGHYSFDVTWR